MSCEIKKAKQQYEKMDELPYSEETKRILRLIKRDRPKAPVEWKKNPRTWLSNLDIDAEMGVYQKHIPDFYYVNATPMDFDKKGFGGTCMVSKLCSLCLASVINKGKRRIGIVFNTDYSDGPGEHWVAVFCDLTPGIERMVYFDSYAEVPEEEIQELMMKWSNQWKEITGRTLRTEYNSTRHQMKNSECGMYCIYFLHCCLFTVPMNVRVPDDVVNQLRVELFKF